MKAIKQIILQTGLPIGFLALLLLGFSACTVRPVYQNNLPTSHLGEDLSAFLSSIVIDISPTEKDRLMALWLKNHLIALLSAGSTQPRSPAYQLKLQLGTHIREFAFVNIKDETEREGRASAGVVVATVHYRITNMKDHVLLTRNQSITSPFDRPRQEYANLEAEHNAKKRAAKELAERIYISLVQDFSRGNLGHGNLGK